MIDYYLRCHLGWVSISLLSNEAFGLEMLFHPMLYKLSRRAPAVQTLQKQTPVIYQNRMITFFTENLKLGSHTLILRECLSIGRWISAKGPKGLKTASNSSSVTVYERFRIKILPDSATVSSFFISVSCWIQASFFPDALLVSTGLNLFSYFATQILWPSVR